MECGTFFANAVELENEAKWLYGCTGTKKQREVWMVPRLLRIWASCSTSRRQRSVSLGELFCFFISFTAVLIPLYSAKKTAPNVPEPIGSLEVLFSRNRQISQRAGSRVFFWSGVVVVARRVDFSTLDDLLKTQGWSSSLVEISGLFLLSDIFIICWPLLYSRPSCTPLWRPSPLSPLPYLPLKNSDHFCWLRVCVVTLGRHFHQPNQPVHSSFHLSCWESCVEHPPHCLLHSCHVHMSFVFPLTFVLLFSPSASMSTHVSAFASLLCNVGERNTYPLSVTLAVYLVQT